MELPPTREEVKAGSRSESFWNKIARQIGNTKVQLHIQYVAVLPLMILFTELAPLINHFVTRFVTGLYASPSSPVSPASSSPSTLTYPTLFLPVRLLRSTPSFAIPFLFVSYLLCRRRMGSLLHWIPQLVRLYGVASSGLGGRERSVGGSYL